MRINLLKEKTQNQRWNQFNMLIIKLLWCCSWVSDLILSLLGINAWFSLHTWKAALEPSFLWPQAQIPAIPSSQQKVYVLASVICRKTGLPFCVWAAILPWVPVPKWVPDRPPLLKLKAGHGSEPAAPRLLFQVTLTIPPRGQPGSRYSQYLIREGQR